MYFLYSGTFIVTVSAEDDDAGLNSQLGYVIHSGGRDNFKIDYTSGVISVANDADLDIDKFGTRYNLIVSLLFFFTCITNKPTLE